MAEGHWLLLDRNYAWNFAWTCKCNAFCWTELQCLYLRSTCPCMWRVWFSPAMGKCEMKELLVLPWAVKVCVYSDNQEIPYFNTLRTGDEDLRFYVTTVQDGWRRFAFLTRWNSVHLQVLLSATPQGGMFREVSHPQALLGSLVGISWKFQFTKIVSEFVINF